MTFLKKGHYIYPGQLKSTLNMDIVAVYHLLEAMREKRILERSYEVYCSNCHRFKGEILDSLTQLTLNIATCDFCNHEFSPIEDTIMIYKVIYDE